MNVSTTWSRASKIFSNQIKLEKKKLKKYGDSDFLGCGHLLGLQSLVGMHSQPWLTGTRSIKYRGGTRLAVLLGTGISSGSHCFRYCRLQQSCSISLEMPGHDLYIIVKKSSNKIGFSKVILTPIIFILCFISFAIFDDCIIHYRIMTTYVVRRWYL